MKKITSFILAIAMLFAMTSAISVSAADNYYFNFNFENYKAGDSVWQFNTSDWGNGMTTEVVSDVEKSSKVMKVSGGSTGSDFMYIATGSGMKSSEDAKGIELNFDVKFHSSVSIATQYRHTNSEGIDKTGRVPFHTEGGVAKVAYDKTGSKLNQDEWYNVNIKTDCETGKSHTVVKSLSDGTIALDGSTLSQASNDMLNYGLPLALLRWRFGGADKEIYLDNMYLKEIDPNLVYEKTILTEDFQKVDLQNPSSKLRSGSKSSNVTMNYEQIGDNIMAKCTMSGTGVWTYISPQIIFGENTEKCYRFEGKFKYDNDAMFPISFRLANGNVDSDSGYFTIASVNPAQDTLTVKNVDGDVTEKFNFNKDTLYSFKAYYVVETGYTRFEITDGVKSAVAVGISSTKANIKAFRLTAAGNIGSQDLNLWLDDLGVYSTRTEEADFELNISNLALDKAVVEEGVTTASVDVTTNASFENYTTGANNLLIVASYCDNELSNITIVPVNPTNGVCQASVNVSANDTRVSAFVFDKKTYDPMFKNVEITK